MLRAKYIRNAPDGNGTLFRGDMYQVPINGLLGGTTGHRLWETKTTAQYSIGTRLVTEDGRVFRYALSSGAVKPAIGAKCSGTIADDGIAANCVLARAVGDVKIDFASRTFAKNELMGGYLIVHGGSNTQQNRMILSNTVAANATVELTLAEPFNVAVDAAQYCEVCPNPYRFIMSASGAMANYSSCLGVPMVKIAASGSYFWLQTWGPLWTSPGPYGMGGDANERAVIFNPDGSLRPRCEHCSDGKDYQLAGFIIQTDSNGNDGPPFIMLQISP